MINDISLLNGRISYYDDEEELEITNEVDCINIEIGEDINDVEGVSRIVSLEILADDVEREILDNLSNELYNEYCDREFFGEGSEQEQDVADFISRITGVPSNKINVSFE